MAQLENGKVAEKFYSLTSKFPILFTFFFILNKVFLLSQKNIMFLLIPLLKSIKELLKNTNEKD